MPRLRKKIGETKVRKKISRAERDKAKAKKTVTEELDRLTRRRKKSHKKGMIEY